MPPRRVCTGSIMNISLLTNLLALALCVGGYFSPLYSQQLLSMGLFALSGAATNWLAVYMLFEKVPLLYGSGVIPNRFEAFKGAIKQLVMSQFFSEANVRKVLQSEEKQMQQWLQPEKLTGAVNYDYLFDKLVEAIMESSFGSMLGMLGGASALESLREKFKNKLETALLDMVQQESFQEKLRAGINNERLSDDLIGKVETIVDERLAELTPQLVKELVQKLIREHLSWLVVWGGVIGAVIGLVVSFL